METQILAPQDLVRKAVIEIAQLPENDLVAVMEFMARLKQRPHRLTVAEIKAEAEKLSAQFQNMSRPELMRRFQENLDTMRADAIAKGTALDVELESD
jgi:hypothetical protein